MNRPGRGAVLNRPGRGAGLGQGGYSRKVACEQATAGRVRPRFKGLRSNWLRVK